MRLQLETRSSITRWVSSLKRPTMRLAATGQGGTKVDLVIVATDQVGNKTK